MHPPETIDDELTCQQLVELVTDYLELALDPRERARFEAHLVECPPCGDYLDQMRRTIALLGRPAPGSLPPDERRRLLALFQALSRPAPPDPAV